MYFKTEIISNSPLFTSLMYDYILQLMIMGYIVYYYITLLNIIIFSCGSPGQVTPRGASREPGV